MEGFNVTKAFLIGLGIVFLFGMFVGCIDPKRKDWIGTCMAGFVLLTIFSAFVYGF